MNKLTNSIRCIAPVGDQCGEAATWVPEENALYWTDVNRFLVHRLRITDSSVQTWHFDEPCVALFLTTRPGVFVLALGSKLITWTPARDERTDFGLAVDGWPEVRFNDGRPGPGGELWIGSMANNVAVDGTPGDVHGTRGVLYRMNHGEQTAAIRRDIGISNTVCFSPDHRHFYFGDTVRNTIWRYDYGAASMSLTNESVFFEGFERGLPDGSTVDADGHLWNCRFGGGCIVRIAPNGSIDRIIEMPCTNTTTCEFGGADLRTLYITTAAMVTQRYERLAGSLFALSTHVPGVAPLRVSIAP